METMYFVLGMLSIIAAAIVSVLVWGVVKINKQQQSLDQMQRGLDEYTTYMSHELERIYNEIAECRSYTDSRFDKLTLNAKQLIKG
jgi:hypothetical protein